MGGVRRQIPGGACLGATNFGLWVIGLPSSSTDLTIFAVFLQHHRCMSDTVTQGHRSGTPRHRRGLIELHLRAVNDEGRTSAVNRAALREDAMKKTVCGAAALLMTAAPVFAAGIERSTRRCCRKAS
ncbi:MAG: hypothetical protein R3E47_05690 [Paracoccaceae bacterium]